MFSNNFNTFYESQGKKAGTYVWSGRLWRILTAAEIKDAEAKAKKEAEEQAKMEAEAKAFDQEASKSGLKAAKKDTGVVINGYVGNEKVIVIPTSIQNIPVIEIDIGAFKGNKNITSVTIGNSVTTIGDGAFFQCTGLTSVIIGNSVTTIGVGVFNGCTSLTSVTIGSGVTSIGKSAFADCSSLTSTTIPDIRKIARLS